jgi:DNA-binding transcriptional regulator YdaS (Cro superfamily)
MTETTTFRPDQTPQGTSQERFVFVDPTDRHARQFEVTAQAARPIGADSPEVNQALEDAHREATATRNEAASRTIEHGAEDAELARAIDWNAQTIAVTREYTEMNGF